MKALRTLVLCLLALAPLAAALAPSRVVAQQELVSDSSDYDAWDLVAARAEDAVEVSRASDAAFQDLRVELVDWRDGFATLQSVNEDRIRTVQSQLEALGTVPEDGAETVEIASRRETLTATLAELRAPGQRAGLANSRADGLIDEIDQLLRTRDTGKLLRRSDSPLSPATFKYGWAGVRGLFSPTIIEIRTALSNPAQLAEFRQNLPLSLFLIVVSLVLLLRGRHWMEVLSARVRGPAPSSGRYLAGFFVSFGQIIVPFLGVTMLLQAIYTTNLAGLHSTALLSSLSLIVLALLVARWMALKIFPFGDDVFSILHLPEKQRRKGRIDTVALGGLYGVYGLVLDLGQFETISETARVAMLFPVSVLTSIFLFRIGQLIILDARHPHHQAAENNMRLGILYYVGRIILIAAVTGPLLAAIGYANASAQLTFPFVSSLGLLAFLSLLQNLVRETYAVATGDRERAAEALWPVLIGLGLILVSLPVFALVWGVRLTTIQDLWQVFVVGFNLGDTRISPLDFLKFLLVFGIGYTATKLLQGVLRTSVLPKTKLDLGGQMAVISGIGYLGIGLAALIAISATGLDLTGIALVAGALSVGIGFGLQNIVSNFVAGIILLIERPISEGDWIEVGGQMGVVRNISVRATRIETFDRTDLIVPNSDLVSGVVTNWTRGNLIGRLILPVGVAYGTDTKMVENVLREIAEAHPMVIIDPPPSVLFRNFGADSLDFEIRAILRDVNQKLKVQSDMNHEIARRFAEEGIEIPFAQRDIWLRNPEVLRGTSTMSEPPKSPEHGEGPDTVHGAEHDKED